MNPIRIIALLVAVAALAFGAAACGDDDDNENGGGETTAAAAEPLALTGEQTEVVLDAGTAAVLEQNQVNVEPIDPAASEGEAIAFPITGGEINTGDLAGTIDHSGGLRFSAGGTQVELTDFVVDTVNGTLTSTAAGADLPTLKLDLSGVQQSDEGGTIVLSNITSTLTPQAAQALNDAFGVSLFEGGLAFGDVTVRATG
jgi:hypothetical protein